MRLIAAALAGLLLGASAWAADLPPPPPPARAPAYVAPPPVYNWGGVYLGLNGGGAFGTSDWTGGVVDSGNFHTSGFLVGGTLGVNWQWGQLVAGLETDFDYAPTRGALPTTFCLACSTTTTWLGTTRGRVGYAVDRLLFYGTAGVAYGNVIANANGVSNASTEVGWTAGAGIEGAFAQNWTARIEYLYVDLSKGSCTTACGTGIGSPAQSVSLKENLIRGGVDYKF